jgi:carbamoyl-phosphate synthase small subunit
VKRAVLALADGTTFEGRSFGALQEAVGEVVFNTSMFGYQEILTDPSYVGQLVTMAYPHIGNVGTCGDDQESSRPHAVGLVVREFSEPSNWRSKESLEAYLERWKVSGLEGIDTRRLVRHLRTHGSQMGVLSSENVSLKALVEKAKAAPGMEGQDLASAVSCSSEYEWTKSTPVVLGGAKAVPLVDRSLGGDRASAVDRTFNVVAVDYGLKRAMLNYLVDAGCRVTVVPAATTSAQILARKPDGVFLTNGPGDPAAVASAKETVGELLGKVPMFGICLGHQILARAAGGKTYKMKFGHRGANQPVQDKSTGKVEITSQNHGFAVDAKSLGGKALITHVNLNDLTVEGLSLPDAQAMSVQYHPESSPGPHDASYLFGRFTQMMGASKRAR